jgi:fumarate hydratase, class II
MGGPIQVPKFAGASYTLARRRPQRRLTGTPTGPRHGPVRGADPARLSGAMRRAIFASSATAWASCAVPADALWGAQTQRAVDNFPISGLRMPRGFIRALGLIKGPRRRANASSACSSRHRRGHQRRGARSRRRAARRAVPGRRVPDRLGHQLEHERQRGHRAPRRARLGRAVHPNDHVNMGQSSNDVIPTAIHVSARSPMREHAAAGARAPARGHRSKEAELGGTSSRPAART